MDLSNILNLTSQIAEAASLFPALTPFAAPIAAATKIGSNFIPPSGGSKPQAVDVTGKVNLNPMNIPNPISLTHAPLTNINNSLSYNPNVKLPNNNSDPSNILSTFSYGNIEPWGMNINTMGPIHKPLGIGYNMPNIFGVNNVGVQGPTESAPAVNNTSSPINFENIRSIMNATNTEDNTGTKQSLLDDLKDANKFAGKMDMIGTGINVLGSGLSLINELNKQPSTMAMAPQYSSVNLDSNQSATINAGMNEVERSEAMQKRLMMDLGVDPMLAGVILNNASNTAKTKILSESERTRQSIGATQAQLNTQIQAQAGHSKMVTDQFNIQKQMAENQLASQNISQSITAMMNALPTYGQSNFSRMYQLASMYNKK